MSAPVEHYRLAGGIVAVEWTNAELHAALAPALAHRRVPPGEPALQLTARVRDGGWPDASAAGRVTTTGAHGISVLDPARRVALELDESGQRGEFCCGSIAGLPAYERAAPFRLLLQCWLPAQQARMLHAGAVGLPGRGAVLLVAPSGGGKSNTVLACVDSPLQLLGEDFLAVSTGAAPCVWSLYSTAKLHARDLPRFSQLTTDVGAARDELDGKAVLALAPRHAGRYADGLPLRAILVLKFGAGADSRIVPAPAGEAAKAMLASILMALPESRRPLFEFVTGLVRRVPVHRLELGSAPAGVAATLTEFLQHGP